MRGSRFYTWEQLALPWYQFRDRVQLFHYPANYLPFLQPCPAVLTLHDMILSRYDENESLNVLRYWRKVMPRCIRRADRIITDSERSKQDIVAFLGVDERKVRVIYPGIDEFFYRMTAAESSAGVENQPLPDQFILLLGGPSPRKNIIRVLEAFALLKQRNDSALKMVVTVPTDAKRKEWSREMAQRGLADQVVWLGYVSRELLRCLYNRALLFVYPSLYEGFGLPLLEAMACGCPLAASNASCLPEVAGDAAVFFDPLSVVDIAAAIEKVLADRSIADDLRQKGVARARRFSWQKTAAETLQVYDELLATC